MNRFKWLVLNSKLFYNTLLLTAFFLAVGSFISVSVISIIDVDNRMLIDILLGVSILMTVIFIIISWTLNFIVGEEKARKRLEELEELENKLKELQERFEQKKKEAEYKKIEEFRKEIKDLRDKVDRLK